jgi:2-Cys peroxiredoxin 5
MRAPLLIALAVAATIKVGDKIPSVKLHHGFPPELVDISERTSSRKVVLVGLPGAFTPT